MERKNEKHLQPQFRLDLTIRMHSEKTGKLASERRSMVRIRAHLQLGRHEGGRKSRLKVM